MHARTFISFSSCLVSSLCGVMAASFLKKLGATDKFLGQIKNLPSAAAVQSQQCKQLVEQAGKVSSWSSEEASEACELVHNLLYVAEDGKKQLLEAIAACMAAPPAETPAVAPKKSRAFLQDYTNLYCMLTSNVWNFVMDARTTPEQACMILCKFANSLGLTHPSEATVGIIALLSHWNLWKAQDVPQSAKFMGLQATKPSIKLYLEKYKNERPVPPQEGLRVLPEDFAQLPQSVRDAFQGDYPVPPSDSLRAASRTMPLRKTNDAAAFCSAASKSTSASLLQALKGINTPHVDGQVQITLLEKPALMDSGQKVQATGAPPLALENGKCQTDSQDSESSVVPSPPCKLPEASGTKTTVESVLEGLKKSLAERKVAEKAAETPPKPKAKAKRKAAKKTESPKKKCTQSKKASPKPKAEKPALEKAEKPALEKLAGKKRLGEAMKEMVFPSWWNCKKDLVAKFPKDTEKRFTSRCYHIVKDFAVKSGYDIEDAKAKGREAHREASERWKCMFKLEAA